MPCPKDERLFKPHLGPTSVFHHVVFLLLLTHQCAGQSQVVTPSQPIEAKVGDDITLPCHLAPAVDVIDETVEWARSDLDPRFVYVWRDGEELESKKHPVFAGRTSLSINKLKDGNISLKLDKVKVSDEGTYRCFVPSLQRESSVQLVVGATSSLIISLEKTDGDEDVSGAVLQCESKGWYPKPEVLWLDGEGKLLSAGPAEPIRGPDGLYTVSSRVTVEKKHSKSFTCRVQQKNINQTRETTINVSDDFIILLSSSSALTAGFAVSLSLCILLFLLLVFFMWRQNRSKSKKTHQPEEGREREQLMSAETEKVKKLSEKIQKNMNSLLKELERREKQLEENQGNQTITPFLAGEQQAEVQRLRDEIEKNIKVLQTLNEELEQKIKEVIQQLQEEQQRRKEAEDQHKEEIQKKEKELQTHRQRLEKNKQELEEMQKKGTSSDHEPPPNETRSSSKAVPLKTDRFGSSISSYQSPLPNETWSSSYAVRAGKQQAEVQRLRDEMQEKEKELQTLMDYWKKENQRLEENRTRGNLSLSSIKLKEENLQRLTEEMWKKEKELQTLNEELEKKNKEDPSTPRNHTNRRPT